MNLPTKITVLRLVLTVFIVLLLWLPFSSFGMQFPTYAVSGVIIDLKYIIAGVIFIIARGEGNGNPLQCSCLENPRDGEAWWASVYGVAQSWTRLK